jgi:hypothetical protein
LFFFHHEFPTGRDQLKVLVTSGQVVDENPKDQFKVRRIAQRTYLTCELRLVAQRLNMRIAHHLFRVRRLNLTLSLPHSSYSPLTPFTLRTLSSDTDLFASARPRVGGGVQRARSLPA